MPSTPPVYLFEDSQVDRLYPLTYSRPVSDLRVGGLTLGQRLARNLFPTAEDSKPRPLAGIFLRPAMADAARLRSPFPVNPTLAPSDGLLLINARWLLLQGAERFETPPPDTAGLSASTVVWIHLSPRLAGRIDPARLHEPATLESILPEVRRLSAAGPGRLIDRPWQLLEHQRAAIIEDFRRLGPASAGLLYPGVHVLDPENVHVAEGVKIWPGALLDAQAGPIIIERDAVIRANAVITGPVYIGPGCLIRTGADIREDSTLGPGTRVGGEISNALFLGHANKQHHGFVGNSIIGEWANLGAGTTTSNLKNTYGEIRMPLNGADEPTGRQFLGALIADHAKLGIGTYLSTGSVVGFASHIIAPRPPRFVPSFAWVTDKGIARADFEKLEDIAGIVLERRGLQFTAADHELWVRIASEWAAAERYPWPPE
ncbi:MAG TPA: putative sugar nucleotidyl transferase [Phycisphaerae bacterium]|nr:putative sugar nucleotidyl transferase [Phycisphaerae bacterium]